MTITVINGTNTVINLSASVGFNYDWKNRVNPNSYCTLDPKAPLVSLNAKYWGGENTEYGVNWSDIGIFAGSIITGIAGVVITIASGGTTLLFMSALGAGFGGLMLGGISVVVSEIFNTPARWQNIKTSDNDHNYFVITGKLDLAPKNGIVEITGGDSIKIESISKAEFNARVVSTAISKSGAESPEAAQIRECITSCYQKLKIPVGDDYVTKAELESDGVLNTDVWVYPSFCGVPATDPVCWGKENISDNGSSIILKKPDPMQRSVRLGYWRIEYVGEREDVVDAPKAAAFRLKDSFNFAYARMVSDKPDGDRHLNTNKQADDSTLFFILKSGACYVFVPCLRQQTYVVNDGGSTSAGTGVRLDDYYGPNPGRSRWVVERVGAPDRKLKAKDLGDLVSDDTAIDMGGVQRRVRIVPALQGERILDRNAPAPCWHGFNVEQNGTKISQPIKAENIDNSKMDWIIVPASQETFYLYSPDNKCYATHLQTLDGANNLLEENLVSTGLGKPEPREFFITRSMGYLSFHPKLDPTFAVYLEDDNTLRIRKWDKRPNAYARWAVIPRAAPK